MIIINNREEFKKHAAYLDILKPKDYPKSYPCILEHVCIDYGIMGDSIENIIVKIPKHVEIESFLKGYEAGRKRKD